MATVGDRFSSDVCCVPLCYMYLSEPVWNVEDPENTFVYI
jgi:hypothetical protein